MSHVGVAQRLEHGPNAAGTGGRAQQPSPPRPRLGITRKARGEGFDPGGATPFGDELLAPGVILAGPQRVRMVRRPTALGQRAEQNEAGHEAGFIDRKLDACRPAFRRSKQHDATRVRRPQHGADILGRDVDARG